MPQETIADRLARGLVRMGFREDLSPKTKKYRVFVPTTKAPTRTTYYVGKAGALRHGATVTTSLAAQDRVRQTLLDLGDPDREVPA
jgi:hypothetical protein